MVLRIYWPGWYTLATFIINTIINVKKNKKIVIKSLNSANNPNFIYQSFHNAPQFLILSFHLRLHLHQNKSSLFEYPLNAMYSPLVVVGH